MKKFIVLLLVIVIMIPCVFLAGVVIGPKLGSVEYEIGEVALGEMMAGTEAADETIVYETTRN